MSFINFKPVYAVAKKEFLDNIRSKWIIGLTIIFLISTLVTSYAAGAQAGSTFGSMEETVIMLLTISSMLIPIIAIMLGYATISGECENGSLAIVLSYPVKRIEVLLGKFFGLGSVLITSIIIGFGIGGIVITTGAGGNAWQGYIGFILLTILLGLLYLSLSICFSSVFSKRTTSLGGGVFVYFWGMIYGVIIIAILYATGGSYESLLSGESFPNWLWWSVYFSPMDMSQMAVMMAFGVTQVMGIDMTAPSYMTLWSIVAVQLIWTIIPLLLAIRFFEKRDI